MFQLKPIYTFNSNHGLGKHSESQPNKSEFTNNLIIMWRPSWKEIVLSSHFSAPISPGWALWPSLQFVPISSSWLISIHPFSVERYNAKIVFATLCPFKDTIRLSSVLKLRTHFSYPTCTFRRSTHIMWSSSIENRSDYEITNNSFNQP